MSVYSVCRWQFINQFFYRLNEQAAVNRQFNNLRHTSRRRSRFTHIGCFEADFFITHVSWTQRSALIPIRFELRLIQVAYGEHWCGLGRKVCPLTKLSSKSHEDQWSDCDFPPQVTSDAVAYDPNECMAARPMDGPHQWPFPSTKHLLIRVHGHRANWCIAFSHPCKLWPFQTLTR